MAFKFAQNDMPILIAEIGGNHEGDFGYAKELVQMAIESGADVIKLQVYSGDKLVSPVESPSRNNHFKKFELSLDQHIELANQIKSHNKIYNASIWDFESLKKISKYLDFYKIGSGDLTHYPILDVCAAEGKPILLSTGLASFDEVEATVARIRKIDGRYSEPEHLCVMQCTSMYPIGYGDANLLVMNTYRHRLGVTVGYSDHTIGTLALEVSASMGASVLEFHFTDKKEDRSFRDHQVSLTSQEVHDLKKRLSDINILKGSPEKKPQEIEFASGHTVSFRRGVYLNKEIKAGEKISDEYFAFLRPCHGVDVRDFEEVIGSRAIRDIKPFEALYEGVNFEKR